MDWEGWLAVLLPPSPADRDAAPAALYDGDYYLQGQAAILLDRDPWSIDGHQA